MFSPLNRGVLLRKGGQRVVPRGETESSLRSKLLNEVKRFAKQTVERSEVVCEANY
jgi:hypothetical protein